MFFGAREQFKHEQANCGCLAQKSAYISTLLNTFPSGVHGVDITQNGLYVGGLEYNSVRHIVNI